MFSVLAVQPQQSLSVITRASFYAKFVQCLPTKTCIPIPVIISLFTLSLVTPFPFSQLEITNSITVRLKLFFYTGTTKDVRRIGSGYCLKFSFVDVAHSWRSFTSAMSRLNEAEHRTANQQPRIHLQLFSHRHRSPQCSRASQSLCTGAAFTLATPSTAVQKSSCLKQPQTINL